MGIYDREYYRDESSSGFDFRGQWSVVTWLIAINAAVFLLNAFTGKHLDDFLKASPESLVKPYLWWQLLTYGFAHDEGSIGHIFWNMFGLWIFGRHVEGVYGPKEFLRFYLVAIFLGGLFWTAFRCLMALTAGDLGWEALEQYNVGLVGASGGVTAVTLLFCLNFPKQTILLMMVLPVPAWFLGAMIILGNLFGSLAGTDGVAFDVHLVGVVLAIVYFKLGIQFGRWTPSFGFLKNPFSRRPRLRVHKGFDEEVEVDDQLAKEADRLLDKINREGIDSLTARERRVLERHSRRVRDRRS